MKTNFFQMARVLNVIAFIFCSSQAWADETTIYDETFGSTNAGNATWANYIKSETSLYTDENTPTIIGIGSGTWKVGNGNAYNGNNLWSNNSSAYITLTFGNISSYSDCTFSFYIRNGAGTSVDRTYSIYTSADGGTNWTKYTLSEYKKQDYRLISIAIPSASLNNFAVKIALASTTHETRIDNIKLVGTSSCSNTLTINPTSFPAAATNGTFSLSHIIHHLNPDKH